MPSAAEADPQQQSDASSNLALTELQLRLDVAARQLDTVRLLIERQEQQLALMEQRAALVVDDWSVLDACRVALSTAAATAYSAADREIITRTIAGYDERRDDWRALPHCKLLVGLPAQVFHAGATSGPDHEGGGLDGATKAAQVTSFREGLEEAQEQLAVLQRVQQHESATYARLQASIAELEERQGVAREEVLHHRFRRSVPQTHHHAPAASTPTSSSSSAVVHADTKRMHSAEVPTIPVLSQSLRLLGLRSQDAALTDGTSTEARWTDALRIAESLRHRCAAKAIGDGTGGDNSATAGPSWRAMVEQTDELAFAIRRAVGATNKGKRSSVAAPTAATSSSIAAADAPTAATTDGGSGAAAAGPQQEATRQHEDEVDDVDDELNQAIAARDETIKRLEAELASANASTAAEKQRADEAEAEAREAGAKAEEAKQQNVALQHDIERVRNENADLRSQLSQVNALLEETKSVVAEIQQAQRDAEDRHRAELAEKDERMVELQREAKRADDRVKSLSVLESAASKWKAREEELVATAESASSANAAAQKALAEVQLELSKLQVRAARDQYVAQEARARLDAIHVQRRDENAQTAEALKAVSHDIDRLRNEATEERRRHETEITHRNKSHREDLDKAQQEKEAVLDERDTLNIRLEGLEERLKATEELLRQARQQQQQQRQGSPRNAQNNSALSPHASFNGSSPLRRVQTMPLSYYSPSKRQPRATPPPLTEVEHSPDPQTSTTNGTHIKTTESAPRTADVVMLFDDEQHGGRSQGVESPSRLVPVPIPHSHHAPLQPALLDSWQTKQLLQRWHARDIDRTRY